MAFQHGLRRPFLSAGASPHRDPKARHRAAGEGSAGGWRASLLGGRLSPAAWGYALLCALLLAPALLRAQEFARIQLDGDLQDWQGLQHVAWVHDPAYDAEWHDLLGGWITEDRFHVYIAVRGRDELPVRNSRFSILFDTDNNVETGYQVNSAGGDVMLQAGALWEHNVETGVWGWRRVPSCSPEMAVGDSGRVVEYRVPKACLNSPPTMRVVMMSATEGSRVDLLPDQGHLSYSMQWHLPAPGARVRIYSNNWFLCYYGRDFRPEVVKEMLNYHVIIINARYTTPALVAYLQRNGVQPKYVLGYISVGEEPEGEPVRMSGDRTGPVYFDGDTKEVKYRNLGYATYYVDSVQWSPWHGDGSLDMNPKFRSRYIYPDAAWRERLLTERLTSDPRDHKKAGLQQLMGARQNDNDQERSANYGFDGIFLDTLDTTGPWNTPLYYPWMAPAYRDMIAWMRETYPDKVILANRGVFFYNPYKKSTVYDIRPYDYNIAPYVDIALYESYSLDSDESVSGISPYFCDNHCVFGPKMEAVARKHKLLMTGVQYDMDRGEQLLQRALRTTVLEKGWLDYVSRDGSLFSVDHFVLDRVSDLVDRAPPSWRNAGISWCLPVCRADGTSGECCNPEQQGRVGLQRIVERSRGEVLLQFDLAVDRSNPVFFNIYRSWNGKDFELVKFDADLQMAAAWEEGRDDALPYEVVQTVDCSRRQYFRVRAQDAHGNEDSNTNTLAFECGDGMVAARVPRSLRRSRVSWLDWATADQRAAVEDGM